MLTPWPLLGFTFLIGCGTALNNPAWQASVGDIVPRADLPAAVALNSVGFNLTRSVGPAIGGLIVATAGAAAAFAVNSLSYLALIGVLRLLAPDDPAEHAAARARSARAMGAGLRYVAMSPNIGKVILRAFLFGLTSVAVLALLPLVARHLVQGGPLVYGVLLGTFGVGAVGGAFIGGAAARAALERGDRAGGLRRLRALLRGRSRSARRAWLTGARHARRAAPAWVLALALFNATVQLSTPALGGRARARALPDRGLRRHGARQLALGQRRRGPASGQALLAAAARWSRAGAVGLLSARCRRAPTSTSTRSTAGTSRRSASTCSRAAVRSRSRSST